MHIVLYLTYTNCAALALGNRTNISGPNPSLSSAPQNPSITITPPVPLTSFQPHTNEPPSESARQTEYHKSRGNEAMAAHKFHEAIDEYSRSIELQPSNAIYFSNRSCAYFGL